MLGAVKPAAGGSSAPLVNSSQAITATSTIAITASVASQICPVTSAAAITLTSNPQIGTGSNGQRVTIQNNGSHTITLFDGNGISLQGTLAIGSTQFATFINLGGFWQLEDTNGAPVWTSFTFQNSFANLGGATQNCEYTKFLNEVLLRGSVTRTGTYTAGMVITNLPTGFRPSANLRFACDAFQMTGSDPVIIVASTGDVQFFAGGTTPASQIASLNGMSFRV